MTNRYISKYAKHNTHFERTDPFKYATWKEEQESHWLQSIVFLLCFYGVIYLILSLGV